MKINIIAVGKLKFEYRESFNSFVKKITPFCSINIIEIKEYKFNNIDKNIELETKEIIKKIPKNSKVILLSLNGKQLDSKHFANKINRNNITFVIGGSNGVIEKYFENKISFSKMTFNHHIFRLMLVEQIYRSFSIKNNTKYHK